METLKHADIRIGRLRFMIAGIACLIFGTAMVLVLALYMHATVHYLFWMRLLAVLVALGGTSRGSTPIKYLLVFLLMIGAGFAATVAWEAGLEPLVLIVAALEIFAPLALCYFTLFDDKVNSYFLHQRWRYFGERVATEKDAENNNGKPIPGFKADVKDELGLFEED